MKVPICSCGIEDETSIHYFLCCPSYRALRSVLLSKISEIIDSDVSILPRDHLNHIILYGSNVFNPISNKLIIEQTIKLYKTNWSFYKIRSIHLGKRPPPQLHTYQIIYIYFLFVVTFYFYF